MEFRVLFSALIFKRRKLPRLLLLMKLSAVFILIGCLQVSARTYSQNVTLVSDNVPLKTVFKKIEKQTGFHFFYRASLASKFRNVNVRLHNVPVEEALLQILHGLPLEYKIINKTIAITEKKLLPETPVPKTVFQLAADVSGVVTNLESQPLAGASIRVKNEDKGTFTDENGRYILRGVNEKAVLLISYVGFQDQEIPVNGRSVINIVMEPSEMDLKDIVVVGYGTQKKINATGAIAQITGKDIENRPITRVSQALQGMVGNLNITTTTAGGAPNATQGINIRGYTGLSGQTGGPLIVVDGVQGGNIDNLNPDDIETISVIKDAASAAIYGSSAPYGVILITTKQGKKGKTPAITYANNLQWATPVNMPGMVNSLDFANLFNEAAVNGGRSPIFSDAVIQRIKDYQAGTFKDETVQSGYPDNLTDSWASWDAANANNDWFNIYFRDAAFSQQHNVGVSGGSDNSAYYVGLGYNDRQGMYNFGDDSYKRFNIRANISTDINKWLNFSLRSTVARELFNTPNTYSARTGGNYMHQIARKWPTVPLFNPDGKYSSTNDVILHTEGGRNKQVTDNAILTGEFNLKLVKGWTATVNYTFNGTYLTQDSHTKTLYAYNPSGAQFTMAGNPNGFQRASDRTQYQVVNAFTKYETKAGDHFFSVLGGFTADLREYTYYAAGNNQLYSDNIPSLSTSFGVSPSVSDVVRRLASEGFFGRLNYSFKDRYLLELNGRYDATSRFLPGVRWKFYPGVSAGWNIDKENFFAAVSNVVSALKLRGSYGSLGDQAFLDGNTPNWYPFYPSLGTTRPTSTGWLFNGTQQAAVTPPGLVNPMLTWVTTTQLNLGLDAAFLDNRLNASFDWYIRKADDFATAGAALPAVLGTGVPVENNAGIETRGFELSLGWRDRIGNVTYGVKGIVSDYQGKVTAFANNPNNEIGNHYVGRRLGEIWGYTTVGLFQTADDVDKAPSQSKISGTAWTPGDVQYADLNGDDIIDWGNNTLDNPGDRSIIGNNTPRYAYSFTGDLQWKGFDLSVFLQGIGKRDAWVGSNYFWGINGDEWQSSVFTEHLDRWTPETPDGYFPKYYLTGQMGKNMQTQTRYLQDASYLRIKNLQVGYSVPTSLLNTIRFSRIRLYISVENLATFTNLIKAMDPELSISDAKIYPLQRTYSLGVNVGL